MILQVTRSEIVKKGQYSGKKVRWQQDRAYEVDPEEVAAFSRQLTKDQRTAGVDCFQGRRKEVDHGSTMEEDIWASDGPTNMEKEGDEGIGEATITGIDTTSAGEEDAEDAEDEEEEDEEDEEEEDEEDEEEEEEEEESMDGREKES
ncbi:hypothetical protein BGX38DRAFT_1146830 [Terfezia claveryi]|nr:hypothetical protein BGX38DRAFT_1146830 [Terfezia claveryi]